MGEESGDLRFAHLSGMALLVEEDEASDPIDINGLGANAVVLDPQMPADTVEQSRG